MIIVVLKHTNDGYKCVTSLGAEREVLTSLTTQTLKNMIMMVMDGGFTISCTFDAYYGRQLLC